MSVIGDFLKALAQLSDPRFRRVLWLGVGLSFALLAAVYALLVTLIGWFVPDTITLPLLGEIAWVDTLLSWASLLLMLALSTFLMVPVASAFTSLFLEEVSDAVEAVHFPALEPAPPVPLAEALRDGAAFLGVIVAANIAAFAAYLAMPPAAPFIFVALNGYLLGREYFQLVAMRRLGRAGARAARQRHSGTIWLAGALMAAPLAIPLVNLLVPVLGAATFTHLFHRLEGGRA